MTHNFHLSIFLWIFPRGINKVPAKWMCTHTLYTLRIYYWTLWRGGRQKWWGRFWGDWYSSDTLCRFDGNTTVLPLLVNIECIFGEQLSAYAFLETAVFILLLARLCLFSQDSRFVCPLVLVVTRLWSLTCSWSFSVHCCSRQSASWYLPFSAKQHRVFLVYVQRLINVSSSLAVMSRCKVQIERELCWRSWGLRPSWLMGATQSFGESLGF